MLPSSVKSIENIAKNNSAIF